MEAGPQWLGLCGRESQLERHGGKLVTRKAHTSTATNAMMAAGTANDTPLYMSTGHTNGSVRPAVRQQRARHHRANNVADRIARVPHTHHQAASASSMTRGDEMAATHSPLGNQLPIGGTTDGQPVAWYRPNTS